MRPARHYWLSLRHRFRHARAWTFWHLLARCASPFGSLELAFLYEMDLARPIDQFRAKVLVSVKLAAPQDVGELAAVLAQSENLGNAEMPSLRQALLRRLAAGELCFLARSGTRIVHYNWISFRRKDSLAGRMIVLGDDAAYCGGAYTVPGWRGYGIHTEVNAAMLRFLQQKDYRRAYTFAHADNRSSRKTIERVGWRRTGIMAAFTPRRNGRSRIWRISGTLEPFLGQRVAAQAG
jgi:hypothetical protein